MFVDLARASGKYVLVVKWSGRGAVLVVRLGDHRLWREPRSTGVCDESEWCGWLDLGSTESGIDVGP